MVIMQHIMLNKYRDDDTNRAFSTWFHFIYTEAKLESVASSVF